jgi:hypothetical protein
MRLLLAFLSLALLARATDVPQQEPLPATKEPFHHVVFENDAIRVIDVQIQPGKTCLYHRHEIPSVVAYLTKSTNKSQTWGQTDPSKFLDRTLNPGESRYAPYDVEPLIHRVTNTGTGLFRVFDIELLHKPASTGAAYSAIPVPATSQWEQKLARSLKVTLEPGQSCAFPAAAQSRLLIGVDGKLSVTAQAQPIGSNQLLGADYRYCPPKSPVVLLNAGTAKATALVVELN